MIAGVIQIVFGVLKLGRFIRLVPHPVMIGFVNGLAIVTVGLVSVFVFRDTAAFSDVLARAQGNPEGILSGSFPLPSLPTDIAWESSKHVFVTVEKETPEERIYGLQGLFYFGSVSES